MSTKLTKNWTAEDVALYKERWKKHNHAEMQNIYSCSKKTITNINREFGLKLGVTPGKVRRRRKDASPAGTILYHYNKGLGRKLAFIINEQGKRMRLHIYNWLKAGNTIPEGYVLFYIEPKRENPDDADNLVLKTRMQYLSEIGYYNRPSKPKAAKVPKERKARVPKQKVVKAPKPKKEKIITSAISSFRRSVPTIKKKEKVYTTADRDLSKMIPVRVNSKTIVYAKCEEDIPSIMQRFSKTAS